MDWTPQPHILQEALEICRSAASPVAAVHARVRLGVEEIKQSRDGMRYLTVIFSQLISEPVEVRQMAGLLLKTTLAAANAGGVETNSFDGAALEFVKRALLGSLCDKEADVRRTASTVITTIITKFGCESYATAFATIAQLVQQTTDVEVALTALDTWKMIVEDELEVRQWESPSQSQAQETDFSRISKAQIIPLLLTIAAPENQQRLREKALSILQIYNARHSFAFGEFAADYFDRYWALLGQIGTEQTPQIRMAVTQAMITVNEYKADAIIANADAVFSLMTQASNDENYDLRLIALAFWPEILRDSTAHPIIESFLPRLVPIFIEHTVYTNMDYAQLDKAQLEDDNTAIPDQASAMAPRFHQGRHNTEEDDDLDDEHDTVKSAWGGTWTVRKGAAFALDSLAVTFRGKILPHCLHSIEQRLQSPDWNIRESGVLALGAISKGCLSELDQFVPNVLTLLMQLSEDVKPLLRSISCWCLNRFSPWFCAPRNASTYLERVLLTLLARMLDLNKCVQEAACSAVAGLEDSAQLLLVPYLPQIFETFNRAFSMYQAKNMLILYDAIGTLAMGVGKALIEAHPPHHSKKVLEPLFIRWNNLGADDYQTTMLCDCMGAVSQALGLEIIQMAPLIAEKCLFLMQVNLTRNQNPNPSERPGCDVLEGCLDLLSFLAETLKELFLPILTQHNCVPIIERCCVDPALSSYRQLKQSCFALIGDLAVYCTPLLRPHLASIVPALASNLTAGLCPVCTNASWALGQLVEQVGAEVMDPYAVYVASQLTTIVMWEYGAPALRQNACITLGRFAGACPDSIAPVLDEVLEFWCQIMARYQTETEKIKSFRGLCVALTRNPQVASKNAKPLLQCVTSFFSDDMAPPPPPGSNELRLARARQLPQEIEGVLKELVPWLQTQCGDSWSQVIQSLSVADQRLVAQLLQ